MAGPVQRDPAVTAPTMDDTNHVLWALRLSFPDAIPIERIMARTGLDHDDTVDAIRALVDSRDIEVAYTSFHREASHDGVYPASTVHTKAMAWSARSLR